MRPIEEGFIPPRPPRPKKGGGKHRCRECGGTGRIRGLHKVRGMGKGMGSDYGSCPTCDGVGYVDDDTDQPSGTPTP